MSAESSRPRLGQPTARFDDPQASAATAAGKIVAAAAIALIGARIPLPQGITVGSVASFVLIPFWLPVLRRYWGARWFIFLGVAALAAGIWLTIVMSSSHATNKTDLQSNLFLVGGTIASIGVFFWAREHLSDPTVALWYGAGLIVGVFPTDPQFGSNPWKFGFAAPIIVLLLALTWRLGHRWLQLLAVLLLAGIDAVSDSRSQFAILLLAAVIFAWQLRPGAARRRVSASSILLVMAGLAIIVFLFGQTVILDGYLGQAAQARSEAQIEASGSLIAGGRPELAATLALMQYQPIGYGAGTVPNLADILVAKAGMAGINYDPNNGYVENYMFGGHIEVHSVLGDLWARFGLIGILLTLTIIVFTLRGVAQRISAHQASGLLVFLGVNMLWNIAFSPLLGSIPLMILLVGLILPRGRFEPSDRALQRKAQRLAKTRNLPLV